MICPCGKPIETTATDPFFMTQYDWKGNIVYAVCRHGIVVVDNRPPPAPSIDFDFMLGQKEAHANSL
ncbi:MAG: hypothetical protein H8D67_26140 [Deltaproteobacteria bacterium]|nr:hypothetical protein [Deltaproteobacteria bacterium]